MRWTIEDYWTLIRGGRFYFLHPRSLSKRIKWWYVKWFTPLHPGERGRR